MKDADLPRVCEIEDASFSAPFPLKLYEAMMQVPSFVGFVVEDGGLITAYMVYSLVADQMEIITIAVAATERRKGYAKLLMQKLIDDAKAVGVSSIFLEVRRNNLGAHTLYSSFGFVDVGVRRGYYKDNGEDAITMSMSLHS